MGSEVWQERRLEGIGTGMSPAGSIQKRCDDAKTAWWRQAARRDIPELRGIAQGSAFSAMVPATDVIDVVHDRLQRRSTTCRPIGARAIRASLMCCSPKGMPMIVTKQASAEVR